MPKDPFAPGVIVLFAGDPGTTPGQAVALSQNDVTMDRA